MSKRYLLVAKIGAMNFAVAALIVISVLMCRFLSEFAPLDPNETKRIEIEIPHGMSAAQIGDLLQREGIIRSRTAFLWSARLRGVAAKLKSGRYLLSPSMSLSQILRILALGKVKMVKFSVPEGLTVEQIADLWQSKGFGTAEEFIRAAHDRTLLTSYGINAQSAEGYLFPETYVISEGTSAKEMVSSMIELFRRRVTPDLIKEGRRRGFNLHQIITLASIIEKEARLDDERPIISAVFHRRLKLGWKLEADPTVRYALGLPSRPLTSDDLKVDSPYNTYLHPGLPPGPICNPGIKSIEAAVNPADVDYLYFVARGDGSHIFSRTYSEHIRAIAQIKKDRRI
ncbi:endolytic transglycosylase MltG [Candidatus Poribacteria bacterium]|nr:endolytic transglycosylase MltG [Candidatus Poribacteria bacterium]